MSKGARNRARRRAVAPGARFDSAPIATELRKARADGVAMAKAALGMFGASGELHNDDLPFLGFIERAQAFQQGSVDMVEKGNPMAAAALIRALAENLAVAYHLQKHPADLDKLRPGASQGLRIGRVVAAAQRELPGFKSVYHALSNMAHPSGAGSFHTLVLDPANDGAFTWQSHPRFKSLDDARQLLAWIDELTELTAGVIRRTAKKVADAKTPHLT